MGRDELLALFPPGVEFEDLTQDAPADPVQALQARVRALETGISLLIAQPPGLSGRDALLVALLFDEIGPQAAALQALSARVSQLEVQVRQLLSVQLGAGVGLVGGGPILSNPSFAIDPALYAQLQMLIAQLQAGVSWSSGSLSTTDSSAHALASWPPAGIAVADGQVVNIQGKALVTSSGAAAGSFLEVQDLFLYTGGTFAPLYGSEQESGPPGEATPAFSPAVDLIGSGGAIVLQATGTGVPLTWKGWMTAWLK